MTDSMDKIEKALDKFANITDKLSGIVERVPNIVLNLGVMFAGMRAANHPLGAVTGMVALELARSNGLISSAAGTATLGLIGLGNVVPARDTIALAPVDGGEHADYMRRMREQGIHIPSGRTG